MDGLYWKMENPVKIDDFGVPPLCTLRLHAVSVHPLMLSGALMASLWGCLEWRDETMAFDSTMTRETMGFICFNGTMGRILHDLG